MKRLIIGQSAEKKVTMFSPAWDTSIKAPQPPDGTYWRRKQNARAGRESAMNSYLLGMT